MMPKVTLLAPEGVRGQIHASQSGENYNVAEDGTVVVNHVDVAALINGGYQHVPRSPSTEQRGPEKPPISSVAAGSHEAGATAIDPAKREALHRELDTGTGQENHDHGGAIPPHGDPQPQPSTDASRADAQAEVDAAKAAGVNAEQRSHVADSGHQVTEKANAADQAEARGEPKETAAEREEREERERMPPESTRHV